ncbi:hypothetical protein [Sinosporangium siamense]|uniref:Uncharacterized protein n=1 Tax=Sinosporangium siamense TaxID=1367973 RepID=A0A919RQL1_9ACTN|nr:hypothetical protein [Sinosporangium siamense]GII97467.1 hypothetical protein Ssi02_76980 [Sinosporangium siamense]
MTTDTFPGLTLDAPVALLPVRLETRFAAGNTLRIRVYPDQIHVDDHEPRLTSAELEAGKRYWTRLSADGSAEGVRSAWEALRADVGAHRATWVARLMEPPAGTLDFPDPTPVRPEDIRAATAAGLPTRWRLVMARGAVRHEEVFAHPVRPGLQLSPGPDLPPEGEGLPLPAGMKWMTDYAEAVSAGMAHTVDLTRVPAELRGGVDRLLVFGVREDGAQPGQDLLAELLENHAATGGLGLVAPGTPTNNTQSSPSGFASVPPPPVTWGDTAPAGDFTESARLTRALGVPGLGDAGGLAAARGTAVRAGAPTALMRVPGAGDDRYTAPGHLYAALFPATLGYFLRHMLTGRVSEQEIEAVAAHMSAFVRADGPLPALRVDTQPYGVLPVMALDAWNDRPGGPVPYGVRMMRLLRDHVWRPALAEVPRVPARPGHTPQEELFHVLGADAVARQGRVRPVYGGEYAAWAWRHRRVALADDSEGGVFARRRDLLRRLGLYGADADGDPPPIAHLVPALHRSFPLGAPLVGDDLSYLAALHAGFTPDDLRTEPGGPRPLLHRLLRFAVLAQYSIAAGIGDNPVRPEPREPELLGVREPDAPEGYWRRLDRTLPGHPPGVSVGRLLATRVLAAEPLNDGIAVRAEPLRRLRAEFAKVAAMPGADLARHLAAGLGLYAGRLDAWITSVAWQRLEAMRAAAPSRTHIGGYGWAVDLAPRGRPAPGGYVHAPSLAQATTASVLRSGWRARGTTEGADNTLAIDLTSRRARLAETLLDGVRQGSPLSALLGYRFERDLREHPDGTLARYLPAFRKAYPCKATLLQPSGRTEGEGTATVVDGLALARAAKAATIAWGTGGLPGAPADVAAVEDVLAVLADAVDAVGDALLAESVHHLVNGNADRASATLDAAARGQVPPPELDFLRTPRSGHAVTHRVVALMSHRADRPGGWPVNRTRNPRVALNPAGDALAASLLPMPYRASVHLLWDAPDGSRTIEAITNLGFLELSALDWLAMMPRPYHPVDGGELERRLTLLAWKNHKPAEVTEEWRLRFDYGRVAGYADRPHVMSVAEYLAQVDVVRRLLTGARPLVPADLDLPGAADELTAEDLQLKAAADAAMQSVTGALSALNGPDENTWREGLLRAAGLGVPDVVPPPAPADISALVAAARNHINDRIHLHFTAVHTFGPRTGKTPRQLRDHDLERLHAALGQDALPLIGGFTAPAQPAMLASFAASTALQGGDATAAADWLMKYARVRPGAGRLQEALTLADATRDIEPNVPQRPADVTGGLQVAQLPHADGDRWWGLPLPRPSGAPGNSRLSIVAYAPFPLEPGVPVCGMVVDEWTETIPASTATTGVAFEYDAPGAAAPQAVLLAVPPPVDGTHWTSELVRRTLEEALDLAMLRTVDHDALLEAGMPLPAVTLPFNLDGEAATTRLTDDVQKLGDPAPSWEI